MYSVVVARPQMCEAGSSSNLIYIDQKENCLKVQDMKKQRKMNRKFSQKI